jgi:hypothetical protein
MFYCAQPLPPPPHAIRSYRRIATTRVQFTHGRQFYLRLRRLSKAILREMRRRTAIEPAIGHVKAEHHMGRNQISRTKKDGIETANGSVATESRSNRLSLESRRKDQPIFCQEFFLQHFTRRHRSKLFLGHHHLPSMIINHSDLIGITIDPIDSTGAPKGRRADGPR